MKRPIRTRNTPIGQPKVLKGLKVSFTPLITAGVLVATALLCAGCVGGEKVLTSGVLAGGEVLLQPVTARGPDPFTDSTVTGAVPPASVTRTPEPTDGEAPSAARVVSGATPGLYGGTQSTGSCDIGRQISFLSADRAKSRAFAEVSGIGQASIPTYLRGLASVVLRADIRVTNHGFHDGRATSYQSVLQAGTAVLVDNRGVPRVRCACGNPIDAPAARQDAPTTNGRPWDGYRPAEVITVTPAPRTITNITIISIHDRHAWIERRIGDDGQRDVLLWSPHDVMENPRPEAPGRFPDGAWPPPDTNGRPPQRHGDDCTTLDADGRPGRADEPWDPWERRAEDRHHDCPAATIADPPRDSSRTADPFRTDTTAPAPSTRRSDSSPATEHGGDVGPDDRGTGNPPFDSPDGDFDD